MHLNATDDEHLGVLLLNLGSPDSTSVRDVRRYLHQFLMDGRVIDVPYLLRKFIVCCTILPFRPKETAKAYKKIWREDGSPLIQISRKVQKGLQSKIDAPVALGMRYGNPSTRRGLEELLEENPGLKKIYLIPLYPHYAMSSYETAVVQAENELAKLNPQVEIEAHPPFYDDPFYIDTLVSSAEEYLNGDWDHLLFSYHGLPERHLLKADPTGKHCLQVEDCCKAPSVAHDTCYRAQVLKTTQAFVQKAGIPEGKYSVAFQSRLGRDPWLQPYTDLEIVRFAEKGIKTLLVICPAFVSDCLETLEEIGIRAKTSFEEAGGKELRLIPCLNDHPGWIEALRRWCMKETHRNPIMEQK